MKLFRTIVSAFLVLLGVMLIVTWAFASKSAEAVENGEAAANLTDKVLSSPAVADLVATKAQEEIVRSVEEQFDNDLVNLALGLAAGPIHDAIETAISSDFVNDAARAGAGEVQTRLVAAMTDPDRPYGPLELTIDVSPRINDRLDQVPLVGSFIPDVTVPSVSVEVVDAATFEDVRSAYGVLQWAATWFIWIGLLLIAVGVFASPRRRWFLSRAMLVAGVVVLAIGYTVSAIGASSIANLMPGGSEGGLGVVVNDLLSDTAIPPIADVLITLGFAALVLALVAAVAVHYGPRLRTKYDESRAKNGEPLVNGQAAATPATSSTVELVPATVGAPADSASAPRSVPASISTSIPTAVPAPDETTGHPRDDDDFEFEEYDVQGSSSGAPTDDPESAHVSPAAAEPESTESVVTPESSAPTADAAATPAARPAKKPVAKRKPATASAARKAPARKPAAKKAPTAKSASATAQKSSAKAPAAKASAPKKPAVKKAPTTSTKAPTTGTSSTPAAKKAAPKKPATRKPATKKAAPNKGEPPTSA
ncbi:hypothetical protein [Demequina aurantiaca]|uniref:hypothetical protein n=1 Tax=Demequina aurantiaca TaxID=676200 RepID=UPI0007830340|nr:hypothetical protein [Demequina aurantiaca]